MSENTIYQFTVNKVNGEQVDLSEFKDKVLLIVNTASGCGFTPQYKDLEDLEEEFSGQGFEVLAFPSNDFGGQEPLQGSAITKFCKINFGTTFRIFDKIHVKGPDAHPLFRFLASNRSGGRRSTRPRWNFHKYLVGRNGEVEDYFYPFTKPTSGRVRKRISKLLKTESDK
ncbi:redoxin domain-containing protein [Pedobacter sp. HMF7647]|uniref:Glutathione peroxidase n=1 Tax=Hufsiella arboris TaxID=2695275 RepID=A0A7K1YA85_9SPHI|nr:glutathione peroxidase [Hufsiella arboris]MXV51340.1 redoxin domain-containing protein [Hufsiella arboris]